MRRTKKIEAACLDALEELLYARDMAAGSHGLGRDPEGAASLADGALVAFVRALGFDDVADAWDAVEPKW